MNASTQPALSGRPVLTRHEITALAARVLALTSSSTSSISLTHTARVITRLANGRVLSDDDGDDLVITVFSHFGARQGIHVTSNQLDDRVLQAMVWQCEALARDLIGGDEEMRYVPQVPDAFVPVSLWHDETVHAMSSARNTVIPEILAATSRERLSAAGFLGVMARAEAFISKEGITAFSEETDSEVTVTARTADGSSSGWAGQAARNWTNLRIADVTARAIDVAKRGIGVQAVEPGRRTAILSPAAVAQLVHGMTLGFDAFQSDQGETPMSRQPRGNKIGKQVMDTRITMHSDPADPEGGYRPYFRDGFATPAMTWIDRGVLKNLAYGPNYGVVMGKTYADLPWSMHMSGGQTPIEQMIRRCTDGIYVNRFSSVDLLDLRSGMLTGVTRDGCFLVRNGKIDRPIKNLRFLESPFLLLNRVEALGVPERAALGYTLPSRQQRGMGGPEEWPLFPMIVPPMMVRDFNFSGLSDAV